MARQLSKDSADLLQAQTPQQRKSNQKFAKDNTAKMGKPEGALKKKQQNFKSPVSPIWLVLLAFVVFGGLIFELISRIFFR
ncbi:hypothetical protein V495_00002 [Pseudogymnoascus sp. VKM F-4514 (FW-929)]|nr:hypothetical protein V495_00002 [Pseudogymnoascus sp. VKM F-4514 (FW-929)]KFY55022.1 hypothetical protein V497_07261 [Pseudogymnoascus sp. VKM F-4516 (FW-969)]